MRVFSTYCARSSSVIGGRFSSISTATTVEGAALAAASKGKQDAAHRVLPVSWVKNKPRWPCSAKFSRYHFSDVPTKERIKDNADHQAKNGPLETNGWRPLHETVARQAQRKRWHEGKPLLHFVGPTTYVFEILGLAHTTSFHADARAFAEAMVISDCRERKSNQLNAVCWYGHIRAGK